MIDRFVESMKPRASHEETYIKALSHAILDSLGLGFHPTKSSTSNLHLSPPRFGRPIDICTHQNCSTAARASVRSRSCFPFFPPHSPFLRMRKSAGPSKKKSHYPDQKAQRCAAPADRRWRIPSPRPQHPRHTIRNQHHPLKRALPSQRANNSTTAVSAARQEPA
jgi:hypothetical protein